MSLPTHAVGVPADFIICASGRTSDFGKRQRIRRWSTIGAGFCVMPQRKGVTSVMSEARVGAQKEAGQLKLRQPPRSAAIDPRCGVLIFALP